MEPIRRLAYAFCHGERGAVTTSSMPSTAAVVAQAWNAESRSWTRYRGAPSHGNASRCPSPELDRHPRQLTLWVSNSLSGGDWELDKVVAVGDPLHTTEISRGHCVSAGEGQRRAAVQ